MPEAKSVESATKDLVSVNFPEGQGFIVKDNSNLVSAAVKIGNKELLDACNKVFSNISEDERQEIMNTAVKNQPANN